MPISRPGFKSEMMFIREMIALVSATYDSDKSGSN